ncbi:DUF3238 domain-containing protein [Bacillus paralicheniformis]|uniref:DUF3238 domain-containing protein n=1 Tax=Bacillus paralicheniformis TaxID=1648923 RepID=UPI00128C3393|nr:DUF3238 domain-containing protein [Bacillus paralicheniformis]MPQ26752.1 DUF3238 domain-containing protein [Bacillus paralicheniformis]
MKKLVSILFFISTLVLSFVFSNSVLAKEPSPVSYEVHEGFVTLNINESGDMYKVLKNDEILYEGPSNQYKDKLTEDVQKYKIGVYEGDKIKNIFRVRVVNSEKTTLQSSKINIAQTHKSFETSSFEQKIYNTAIETVTDNSSVILKWEKIPNKDGVYEIYRDEDKVAQTKDLTFIDNDVTPGKEYIYTIKTSIDMPSREQNKLEKKLKEKDITLTKEDKEALFSINGSISTQVKVPTNTEDELNKTEKIVDEKIHSKQKSSVNAIPKDNMYSFVYKTFIPYKSVKDPHPLGTGYLKGDNRGFSFYSNKFRTESDIHVQFSGPTSLVHRKSIGKSYRCKDADCKTILESGTASSKGLKHEVISKSSSKMGWYVSHAIAFPFGITYPNIDYSYQAELTKYKLAINGNHDGAPNHEFYLLSPSDSKILYQYQVKSKNDFWKLLDMGLTNPWSVRY